MFKLFSKKKAAEKLAIEKEIQNEMEIVYDHVRFYKECLDRDMPWLMSQTQNKLNEHYDRLNVLQQKLAAF